MEKNSQTKSVFTISGRHRFVACVILVILVSCATFAYLSCCYKQAQNSLYSIFKTDEMLNKAETEAKGIHKLLDEAKQTTETITTQCQIMMAQQKGHGVRPPSPVPPLAPQTDDVHSNEMGGERDDS